MDEKVRALHARVIHSPVPVVEKAKFVRALRTELRRGEYDVLHCHHDIVSAVYLLAASVCRSIGGHVHVHHNADEAMLTPAASRSVSIANRCGESVSLWPIASSESLTIRSTRFSRDAHAVPNAMPCTITDWIQRCSRISPPIAPGFAVRAGSRNAITHLG